MQRGFYLVDPAVLPAAGVKGMSTGPEKAASVAREARKAALTQWQSEELMDRHPGPAFVWPAVAGRSPTRTLARTGLTAVCGGLGPESARGAQSSSAPTPRAAAGSAQLGRVRDPRMLGEAAKRSPPGMDLLLDGIRRRLQQSGLRSVADLERLFREIDTDGSGVLSRGELTSGLLGHRLLSNEAECDLLYDCFDLDRSGSVDWHEFVDAVRGQLSDARRAIVQEAFAQLDATGDGVLSADDLRLSYRCYCHPDVRSGLRTEDQVYQEILGGLDVISGDGNVTLAEFERFHENSSALISSDEMFVQMVRSAWNLAGATGGQCLRLRITLGGTRVGRSDANPAMQKDLRGSFGGIMQVQQRIVEIRPDLPMNQQDPRFQEAALERLREMGYDDVTDFEVLDRA